MALYTYRRVRTFSGIQESVDFCSGSIQHIVIRSALDPRTIVNLRWYVRSRHVDLYLLSRLQAVINSQDRGGVPLFPSWHSSGSQGISPT